MSKRIVWTPAERQDMVNEGWRILLERGDFNPAHRYPLAEVLETAQKNVFLGKPERMRLNIGKLPNELADFRKIFNEKSRQHDRDVHDKKVSFIQVQENKSVDDKLTEWEKAGLEMASMFRGVTSDMVRVVIESEFPRLKLIGKELSLQPSTQGLEAERLELISIVRWLQDRDAEHIRRIEDLETNVLQLLGARPGTSLKEPGKIKPNVIIIGLLKKYNDIITQEFGKVLNIRYYDGMQTEASVIQRAMKDEGIKIIIPKYMSPKVMRAVKHSPDIIKITGGLTQLRKVLLSAC